MTSRRKGTVTDLLAAWAEGTPGSEEALLRQVYDELHRIAAAYLGREAGMRTLQPTELIHEAYLRFSRAPHGPWENRHHFFGVAAQAMRRVLVDQARKRKSQKRAPGRQALSLEEVTVQVEERPRDLLALDDALSRLEKIDPIKARVVELRFFAGFSHAEVAEILSFSRATAERHWYLAQAWLFKELSAGDLSDEAHGGV
jgi:RNA polymerase sigma factor (TIGR02999 family)